MISNGMLTEIINYVDEFVCLAKLGQSSDVCCTHAQINCAELSGGQHMGFCLNGSRWVFLSKVRRTVQN